MVRARTPRQSSWKRRELLRQASAATDLHGVFAAASARLQGLVAHDASAWLMTDPETGLPTAPTRTEGIRATEEQCSAHWRHEFVHPDVNLFRHLIGADVPAATLRHRAPDPERSARYRRFLKPQGFADELRTVLRVGDVPWATVTLWRREGSDPFSGTDTALLAGLSEPLGAALRELARAEPGPGSGGPDEVRPGLLVFDAEGHLASADDQAAHWLEQLPADDRVTTRLGVRVPFWMLLTVIRAREPGAAGHRTVTNRVRTVTGRWMVCHASTTHDAEGSPAGTVVVLEPASPSRLAPLLVEAYGLTPREQEITRLVARGLGTEAIAAELFLSPHTVKDHVKAVLAKVGVTSRGELVARLYAEHYEPVHLRG